MAELTIGSAVDPATHARLAGAVAIPSADLTTHGVIVGMTGSGKTGLGVVLLEEALGAGIPALVIDPKGDLTNLCLMFPQLRPTDFAPWVNDGDARRDGVTVEAFAAAEATRWKNGLAEWGIDGARLASLTERVDFTIYTPGSSAGIGLNIVGSLRAPADVSDAETVADEIEGFVSGLLGLVGIAADPLQSKEHILLSNLILHEWTAARDLDLPALVGMVQNPPLRKLGVFELDQFYPPKERTQLAVKLNGLLASPSFAAWMQGPALDIAHLLHTTDGRPRCAIVTTAHLSDEERQFATTLLLTKLVTWMRGQSGTTDLRALVYMDEVAGYLPPTASPPTKRPIMVLMKQARAFGVGMVLATQNPVDIDYKALSNAGTWMIGRLQTERDKDRLLAGMTAASGNVDAAELGNTISGLAKREFVLRRAGKDQPEVFTTRWAMSYLRGPLTRNQIMTLMEPERARPDNAAEPPAITPPSAPAITPPGAASTGASVGSAVSTVMPAVAEGTPVRWADPAAPWLGKVGADPRGTQLAASIVARVALRYDDASADLVHDEVYEAVLFPLAATVDVTRTQPVDYDERDLRDEPPLLATYQLAGTPLDDPGLLGHTSRELEDHLARTMTLDLAVNRELKLFGRPGESAEQFASRCLTIADQRADEETAKLRDKYAARVSRVQEQLRGARDRAEVLHAERGGRWGEEILSTAGSVLGGLLGGRSRSSILGRVLRGAGAAAGRRGRSAAAGERLQAQENRIDELAAKLESIEQELSDEVVAIDRTWMERAKQVTTAPITLERADVRVTHAAVVWLPTS